ncbi:MAG TPA: ABC-F family ATP-binding cassette domain-containing protein [Rhodospirillales bacterium]|nr:ABC-F family ATP-binding cassette domain-containing protein [Rhodospirillales bacterium]
MLHINDLTYRIGGRVLFDQASVALPAGHKAGLVGRNGTGKSTLFKMILDEVHPDTGSIKIRNRVRIGTVAQEAPSGPTSLIDAVLAADTERSALLIEAESATEPGRIADIHTRLADIEAHTAPARAAAILSGLGFNEEAQRRPCSDFSGGWRMRVALAAVLFSNPDLLLLDEPTNHLDLEATLWLESYLANWRGTMLVISHDRTLLNASVNEIIHLQATKLTRYAGGYDRFEKTRAERLVNEAKMRTKQLAAQRHIQSFVDRFRAQANKAKQAQSRIKMLARMQPIASMMEERTIAFDFPDPEPLSPPIIALEETEVGYETDKPVLKGLDLRIDMDDRIGLIGANGNGKSTLVKLLSGRLKPMGGKLRKSSKLRVGYFAQHQTDELGVTSTAYQIMATRLADQPESKVRAHLGRFGFGADKADTLVADLSGGEKARLLFAVMSLDKPHVLLLDEPTNHLDVDTRESLVHALNDYNGAVILVSHDPHLIELVCDRLWLVEGGGCRTWEGDLGEYRNKLLDERRTNSKSGNAGSGEGSKNRKQARKERARARAETAGLRKSAREDEKHVVKLEKRKSELESRLSDPEIYEGPTATLMELQVKLGKIKTALGEAEDAWMEMEAEIEATEK